jgi:hypothetical protein
MWADESARLPPKLQFKIKKTRKRQLFLAKTYMGHIPREHPREQPRENISLTIFAYQPNSSPQQRALTGSARCLLPEAQADFGSNRNPRRRLYAHAYRFARATPRSGARRNQLGPPAAAGASLRRHPASANRFGQRAGKQNEAGDSLPLKKPTGCKESEWSSHRFFFGYRNGYL